MPAIGLGLALPFGSAGSFQSPATAEFLLLEDGFFILLEDGSKLIL